MSTILRRLAGELLTSLGDPVVDPAVPETRVDVARYFDPERLRAERHAVFERCPTVLAHRSELADPGDCIVDESTGRSIVVVRGNDGVARGFLNACRHRGTRLATASCSRKAFVCPYHGWTYDLSGQLIHIPHESAFTSLEDGRRSLVAVPVAERHGFVWLGARTGDDVAAHLGPLDAELFALGLGDHSLFVTRECERETNWKLVIDLFLEGYHLRTLHRNSIYPFFIDARGRLERFGDHVAAVSARRPMMEAAPRDLDRDLRGHVTPNFLVFPNTVLILHPDYISRLTVVPLAVDRVRWVHSVLIPTAPTTEAERDHWQRSVDLIEGKVFQAEDLHIAEEMHRGLASGADTEVVFGKLEGAVGWFHNSLDAAIAADIGERGSTKKESTLRDSV